MQPTRSRDPAAGGAGAYRAEAEYGSEIMRPSKDGAAAGNRRPLDGHLRAIDDLREGIGLRAYGQKTR